MLSIEQHTIGFGITVLYVQGRITIGRSAQELEWKVDELLNQQVKRIVFDLTGVTFLDSTGIGIVVMCAAKLKEAGGSLRISGAPESVIQILDMCRVTEIVPVYATLEDAAESFGIATGAS